MTMPVRTRGVDSLSPAEESHVQPCSASELSVPSSRGGHGNAMQQRRPCRMMMPVHSGNANQSSSGRAATSGSFDNAPGDGAKVHARPWSTEVDFSSRSRIPSVACKRNGCLVDRNAHACTLHNEQEEQDHRSASAELRRSAQGEGSAQQWWMDAGEDVNLGEHVKVADTDRGLTRMHLKMGAEPQGGERAKEITKEVLGVHIKEESQPEELPRLHPLTIPCGGSIPNGRSKYGGSSGVGAVEGAQLALDVALRQKHSDVDDMLCTGHACLKVVGSNPGLQSMVPELDAMPFLEKAVNAVPSSKAGQRGVPAQKSQRQNRPKGEKVKKGQKAKNPMSSMDLGVGDTQANGQTMELGEQRAEADDTQDARPEQRHAKRKVRKESRRESVEEAEPSVGQHQPRDVKIKGSQLAADSLAARTTMVQSKVDSEVHQVEDVANFEVQVEEKWHSKDRPHHEAQNRMDLLDTSPASSASHAKGEVVYRHDKEGDKLSKSSDQHLQQQANKRKREAPCIGAERFRPTVTTGHRLVHGTLQPHGRRSLRPSIPTRMSRTPTPQKRSVGNATGGKCFAHIATAGTLAVVVDPQQTASPVTRQESKTKKQLDVTGLQGNRKPGVGSQVSLHRGEEKQHKQGRLELPEELANGRLSPTSNPLPCNLSPEKPSLEADVHVTDLSEDCCSGMDVQSSPQPLPDETAGSTVKLKRMVLVCDERADQQAVHQSVREKRKALLEKSKARLGEKRCKPFMERRCSHAILAAEDLSEEASSVDKVQLDSSEDDFEDQVQVLEPDHCVRQLRQEQPIKEPPPKQRRVRNTVDEDIAVASKEMQWSSKSVKANAYGGRRLEEIMKSCMVPEVCALKHIKPASTAADVQKPLKETAGTVATAKATGVSCFKRTKPGAALRGAVESSSISLKRMKPRDAQGVSQEGSAGGVVTSVGVAGRKKRPTVPAKDTQNASTESGAAGGKKKSSFFTNKGYEQYAHSAGSRTAVASSRVVAAQNQRNTVCCSTILSYDLCLRTCQVSWDK
jgi:hypothetical protein